MRRYKKTSYFDNAILKNNKNIFLSEIIEKIEDLQKNGNTIEKIALILKCSKQAVNTRIKRKKLGL